MGFQDSSGWSSCSGTARWTGLYELIFRCLCLQITHAAEADNPTITMMIIDKITVEECFCHRDLYRFRRKNHVRAYNMS